MRTRMHSDAIPGADPATLADPMDVAAKLVLEMIECLKGIAPCR